MQTPLRSFIEIFVAQCIGAVIMLPELIFFYGGLGKNLVLVLIFKVQSIGIWYLVRRYENRKVSKEIKRLKNEYR